MRAMNTALQFYKTAKHFALLPGERVGLVVQIFIVPAKTPMVIGSSRSIRDQTSTQPLRNFISPRTPTVQSTLRQADQAVTEGWTFTGRCNRAKTRGDPHIILARRLTQRQPICVPHCRLEPIPYRGFRPERTIVLAI